MRTTDWVLTNGLFVDVKDDWRVLVVEADLQRPAWPYIQTPRLLSRFGTVSSLAPAR